MTVTAPARNTPAPPDAAAGHGDADWSPSPRGWAARYIVLAAFFLAVVVLPTTVGIGSQDFAGRFADGAIFAIIALSVNIILGYTGQLSLGHQGFVGAGAFAAAYGATELGVPFAATFVLAGLVGGLFALGIGAVALRITGLYLALITLVFGLTLERSLFEVPELTNGGAGQPADRPDWLLSNDNFYWFCLAMLAVVLYVDWRLTRSKAGRALLALRENERVAEAFGVNVTSYKLLAFVLSGGIAGIGGALFAYREQSVVGVSFSFELALTFVLMTVVGGLNSRVGVVAGGTLFALLDYILERVGLTELLHPLLGESAQFSGRFLGALLLLLTLIFNPGGIAQQLKPITNWFAGKRFSLHGDHESGPAAVEGSSVRA
jgi:branched-chain amino acid transport system permease protein